jgi:hypothetical protein
MIGTIATAGTGVIVTAAVVVTVIEIVSGTETIIVTDGTVCSLLLLSTFPY